jgi:hypothetical protein
MKHFDKIVTALVTIPFPAQWGDPQQVVEHRGLRRTLHEAVWLSWSRKIHGARDHVHDATACGETRSVMIEVAGPLSEEDFDEIVAWCEQLLLEAYEEVACPNDEEAEVVG